MPAKRAPRRKNEIAELRKTIAALEGRIIALEARPIIPQFWPPNPPPYYPWTAPDTGKAPPWWDGVRVTD